MPPQIIPYRLLSQSIEAYVYWHLTEEGIEEPNADIVGLILQDQKLDLLLHNDHTYKIHSRQQYHGTTLTNDGTTYACGTPSTQTPNLIIITLKERHTNIAWGLN